MTQKFVHLTLLTDHIDSCQCQWMPMDANAMPMLDDINKSNPLPYPPKLQKTTHPSPHITHNKNITYAPFLPSACRLSSRARCTQSSDLAGGDGFERACNGERASRVGLAAEAGGLAASRRADRIEEKQYEQRTMAMVKAAMGAFRDWILFVSCLVKRYALHFGSYETFVMCMGCMGCMGMYGCNFWFWVQSFRKR